MPKTATYTYILLDWDGCVAQTLDIWTNACQEALAGQGIITTSQEVWNGIRHNGVANHFEIPDKQMFRERVTTLLQQQQVELYDGVKQFLAILHSNKKFAVVSNTRNAVLQKTMQRHNLQSYFDVVIDDKTGSRPKPNPEGIHMAMHKLGAIPAETIMVGDSPADIGAARNAGIDSVLFYPPPHHHLYELEWLLSYRPSYVVNSFSELGMLLM
jgi:HAD superfamily hydrolase (TIGR01509 family)